MCLHCALFSGRQTQCEEFIVALTCLPYWRRACGRWLLAVCPHECFISSTPNETKDQPPAPFICGKFPKTTLFSGSSKLSGTPPSQNWGPSREPARP